MKEDDSETAPMPAKASASVSIDAIYPVSVIEAAEEEVGGDVQAVICAYPWPCEEALAVAWCESRHDARAVDAFAENWGLFQINEQTWRPYFGEERWARVLEASENTAMAWEIYERGGRTWLPWSCRP